MNISLIVTLAIQVLASMAALTVPVLAPAASQDIGLSATLVGVFMALVYAAAMFSSLASGGLIARYGAIRTSQLCLLSCGVGLACVAVGNAGAMVLSAVLIGLGYGPVTPASSHILARTTPAHRMGLIFSLKQTGVPLGGVMAGLLIPGLVLLWQWQGAALAAGLACLVVAALAQPIRAAFDADRSPAHRLGIGGVFRPLQMVFEHRRIRNLALCTFFLSAMQLCLTSYLVTYLTGSYGVALVTAGLVHAASQTAGAVGRLLWGWVADRSRAPDLVLALLAFAMAGASLLTALFRPDWPLTIVIVVSMVFGGTAIGWNGVYLAQVAQLAPKGMAGQMTGGTLFFTYFGVVLGPPAFAGLVSATDSMATGFAGIGAVIFVVGCVLLYVRRAEKRAA